MLFWEDLAPHSKYEWGCVKLHLLHILNGGRHNIRDVHALYDWLEDLYEA